MRCSFVFRPANCVELPIFQWAAHAAHWSDRAQSVLSNTSCFHAQPIVNNKWLTVTTYCDEVLKTKEDRETNLEENNSHKRRRLFKFTAIVACLRRQDVLTAMTWIKEEPNSKCPSNIHHGPNTLRTGHGTGYGPGTEVHGKQNYLWCTDLRCYTYITGNRPSWKFLSLGIRYNTFSPLRKAGCLMQQILYVTKKKKKDRLGLWQQINFALSLMEFPSGRFLPLSMMQKYFRGGHMANGYEDDK